MMCRGLRAIVFSLIVNGLNAAFISTPGDIIIGGIFPVHKEGDKENSCGPFNEIPGYQYMESMLYALDKINKNRDILPGIKLGTIIYDTCRSPTIAADKTKEFIKLTLSHANNSEFAGVIGPFTSGNSKIVANFLRVFEIPQISYASLSVQLSDKVIYNYFFRTVPPDSYFAEALGELLQRLGWSYVSIIYSKGTYPESGTQEVIKALNKRDICVANEIRLPRFPKKKDFDYAIEQTTSFQKANVVLLVTIQRDSRGLLEAKERYFLAKRLNFIGSIAWSNRDDITKGLGHVADGTITFGHQEGNVTSFEEYFRSLNLSNYNQSYRGWFEEFWQKQFNCSLRNATDSKHSQNYTRGCTGDESLLKSHMEIAPVRVVINAVTAMAYALHNMHRNLCPNSRGLCERMRPMPRTLLREYLKNVSFPDSSFQWPIRFNKNNEVEGNYTVLNFRSSGKGLYSYCPIGTWMGKMKTNGDIFGRFKLNLSNIRWFNGNTTAPSSVCSLDCNDESVKLPRPGPARMCCWDCETCDKNDVIVNNTCQTCVEGFVPDANLSHCSKLQPKYLNVDTPLAILIIFFASVGIVGNLAVFTAFFMNREHRLIKASGREMCYFMFLGIFVVFMVSFSSLTKPTQELCYFRRLIMGMSYTICYAPLLMKIWRIHRIFKSANELKRTTGLIGRRSQLLITVGLVTIQGLFCVLIFSTDPPNLIEKFYPESEELLLECSLTPSVFVAYLAYNVVLMFLCTVYAFLTRHFPKNFNEAMYIGVTMYLTCVVWVVFLACFLNVSDSFSRVYWISGASVVIGWITLLGLFAPKVYHVYTKTNFGSNILITWGSTVFERSQSSDEANGPAGQGMSGVVTVNATAVERNRNTGVVPRQFVNKLPVSASPTR